MELSPCTRFVILGCANATARMFDVISGQCVGVMAGHASWVVAARFTPDGRKAITASHDGTARCGGAVLGVGVGWEGHHLPRQHRQVRGAGVRCWGVGVGRGGGEGWEGGGP